MSTAKLEIGETSNKKIKLLITDALFPNKYSSWRNVEILSLIEEFETTILVKHGKSWAGIIFDIDWGRQEYGNRLQGYNFLIFDPEYNFLNSYNKDFDGTIFNGYLPNYTYALTKDVTFDVSIFDHYYHIFLGSFLEFNSYFKIPESKQTIHLYPGGGYTHEVPLRLSKSIGVVSTFPTTSKKLALAGVPHIDCWSVPLYMKNEHPSKKRLHNMPLRVCFASLGHGTEKGDKTFRWVARIMSTLFRHCQFEFISIGNCSRSRFIRNIPPMSWRQLESFYAEHIDIYINPVSRRAANGWPIGQEAMKQGCVAVTYDVNNVADWFHAKDFQIQIAKNPLDIIKYLLMFNKNRHMLLETSVANQQFVNKYAGYDNQQRKIFEFIRGRVEG